MSHGYIKMFPFHESSLWSLKGVGFGRFLKDSTIDKVANQSPLS